MIVIRMPIAERRSAVREELLGEQDGLSLVKELGIPTRTVYQYETGVMIPAEILLEFIELTHVRPARLLRGEEPRYDRSHGFSG